MVGRCPEVQVLIKGRPVPCVLDKGSQVTLFRQSFFMRHFGGEELRDAEDLRWLTLSAANGLRIPFVGYIVLDFNVAGIEIPGRAALIVEDRCISSDNGLLGMNVIAGCWENITQEGFLGKTAFKSRVSPKAWGAWGKRLSLFVSEYSRVPLKRSPVVWPGCGARPRL